MSQTTTQISACDVSVWLDNASGTLTDISGSSNSVNLNFDKEIGMLRTFQSRWPVRQECGKDAQFELIVVYSTAADEGSDILKDWFFESDPGVRTLKVYVPDKNVGADVYSAEVRMENLNFPLSSGNADPVQVTARLLPTGAVSLTTNAT